MANNTKKTDLNVKTVQTVDIYAKPSLAGSKRTVGDIALTGNWSPNKIVKVLNDAKNFRAQESFIALANEIIDREPGFKSNIGIRKSSVENLNWVLEGGREDINTFIIENFDKISLPSLIGNILDANVFGFSCQEIVMAMPDEKGFSYLDCIDFVEQRHLKISEANGNDVYKLPDLKETEATLLDSKKFIIAKSNLRSGNPYRASLIYTAAIYYMIKVGALKSYFDYVESAGKPSKIGKYKPGSTEEDLAVLRQAVYSLGSDMAALLPEDMSLDFLKDSNISMSSDMFLALIRYADEQMRVLVLGSVLVTGTSTTGAGGSLALGKVHSEVRFDLIKSDALFASRVVNEQLIKFLVAVNADKFGKVSKQDIPKFRLITDDFNDYTKAALVIKTLSDAGYVIDEADVEKMFKVKVKLKADAAAAVNVSDSNIPTVTTK